LSHEESADSQVILARFGKFLYESGAMRIPAPDLAKSLYLITRGTSRGKFITYIVLLTLSAVIAVGGVLMDSTAVVIGAMIVTPLATPILAIGLSIVTVKPQQVFTSAVVLVASLVCVVLISFLLSLLSIVPIDVASNAQISGRTSPNAIDLVVAIATGLVGAYAVSHRGISQVIPGVAIAISLVPALVVAGACMESGQWEQAQGALLLFMVNAVAMVITAIIVFTIAGYFHVARESRSSVAKPLAFIVVLLLVLSVPIAAISFGAVRDAATLRAVDTAVSIWLEGTDFQVTSVTLKDNLVTINVAGPGEAPSREIFVEAFNAPMGAQPEIVAEVYSAGLVKLVSATK